jgi:hypothetical protein
MRVCVEQVDHRETPHAGVEGKSRLRLHREIYQRPERLAHLLNIHCGFK